MDKRVQEVIEQEAEENIEDEIVEDDETESDEADENLEETDADEDGEEEEEIPTAIVEVDGEEFEVPESLKSAIMRNKDYTQKTQELSAFRRDLEEERKLFEEERKRDEEDFKLQAQLLSLEDQLKTYETVDWTQLEQTDPEAANSHWRQFQMLKDRKNDLGSQVEKRQTERSQTAQQTLAKRVEETKEFAEKNIEGWDAALASEIEAFAIEQGFTQESLLTNLSPALVKALHVGLQGQKMKSKVAKPAKKKTAVKPLRKVRAKSGVQTSRKDPEDMTYAEYEAWRKKQGG